MTDAEKKERLEQLTDKMMDLTTDEPASVAAAVLVSELARVVVEGGLSPTMSMVAFELALMFHKAQAEREGLN